MAWQILTAKDFETSRWAGGITTQLAIGPAGAQYPNRDFLWRISSAQVELEHSVFTNLHLGFGPEPGFIFGIVNFGVPCGDNQDGLVVDYK